MRVTEKTNYNLIRDTMSRSKGRIEDLQQQSATMKKLNTPSDDPVGAAKVLEVRTDKVNNDQFQANARQAEAFLNNTDHALGEIGDILVRAKEIAIGQSSGASANADTRIGVAEEVSQLYQQAVALANRRVGDRFVFGGYKTQKPPIDPDGRYQGDDGQMMVEIARDVFLASNVTGLEAFNTHPKASRDQLQFYERGDRNSTRAPAASNPGAPDGESAREARLENVNVFDELQNLRIALLTGSLDGIHSTLDRLDDMHGKVIATRAKVGSRINGLQSASQSLEKTNLTNANLTSTLEDADMARVVSDLTKEETVYKSSLASSQKLIQPTLLDFLR